ncbi:TIGR02391 family protein [Mycobacteroides abscessus]|uniref:TIGR02391 family protein n=1 Tax=Mycobacteroides abscessus TaxID=36809 RepID=UPI0019D0CCEE|nr:TIGR02391 family protein [Mycobacteroides abscessus]MBN7296614.1 TIGR02391 family protein [Mycobacteroides abscessus subsp. abscessus]
MAASTIAPFGHGSIENIARIIGELYTGPELTRILASVGMPDPLGDGQTKWKRLAASMQGKQYSQRDGRPVLAVIIAAMKPEMVWDRQAKAAVARDELTQVLSLSGYRVRDNGTIGPAEKAATASEASARTQRLRKLLEARDAHPEVIRHCREELLRKDCYEAVFEAVKGMGARLREKSGLDEDGRALVQAALRGKQPRVLLTNCSTVTERNEQEGVALLAEGVFAAFRNPAAHEPRLVWEVSEQDALDVLGTLSMIHRRLDGARRSGSS